MYSTFHPKQPQNAFSLHLGDIFTTSSIWFSQKKFVWENLEKENVRYIELYFFNTFNTLQDYLLLNWAFSQPYEQYYLLF